MKRKTGSSGAAAHVRATCAAPAEAPQSAAKAQKTGKAVKGKAAKGNAVGEATAAQPQKELREATAFINDIFGGSKAQKRAKVAAAAVTADEPAVRALLRAAASPTSRPSYSHPVTLPQEVKPPAAKRSKGASSASDLFGREAEARAKTEEGYNVYSEEELGLNKQGGDSALCPFDCTCCY